MAFTVLMLLGMGALAQRHTRHTFFSNGWKYNKEQVAGVITSLDNQYKNVLHHGPAVENQYMALRIYFNNSGAIDVYNKSGLIDNELGLYGWYPSEEQQASGAGCDEYRVGKAVGLGGFRLWDGSSEVKITATKGRRAWVGRTAKGAYAEMIALGVPYKEDTVDISIRIDMRDDSRWAKVTARELNGKEVQFATGVNYHSGEELDYGSGYIAVWGIHPADVSQHPQPIGGGMRYDTDVFSSVEKTADMLRIVSKPCSRVSTSVVAASVKEAELNNASAFTAFVKGDR